MAWRLVEIPENETLDSDLTNSELVGVSVMLAHGVRTLEDFECGYGRAYLKIQPQVQKALDNC